MREKRLQKENGDLKTAVDQCKTKIYQLEKALRREKESRKRETSEMEKMYTAVHCELTKVPHYHLLQGYFLKCVFNLPVKVNE